MTRALSKLRKSILESAWSASKLIPISTRTEFYKRSTLVEANKSVGTAIVISTKLDINAIKSTG